MMYWFAWEKNMIICKEKRKYKGKRWKDGEKGKKYNLGK